MVFGVIRVYLVFLWALVVSHVHIVNGGFFCFFFFLMFYCFLYVIILVGFCIFMGLANRPIPRYFCYFMVLVDRPIPQFILIISYFRFIGYIYVYFLFCISIELLFLCCML